MELGSKELNFDLGNGFVPKAITNFLKEISVFEDGKKLAKLHEYVLELEEEMKKIHVFKRELPFCMLLLGDAIGRLKEEAVRFKERKGKAVMMEKFIHCGDNSDEDEGAKKSDDLSEKKNWLSSAQLWTTPIEYDSSLDRGKIQDSSVLYQKSWNPEGSEEIDKKTQLESWNIKKRVGAFMPFKKRCGENGDMPLPGDGLSLSPPAARCRNGDRSSFRAISQASSLREQPQQQRQETLQQPKKQRRSWSPDLHRRFVNALEQLGGAQEATPKQIREVMQVTDLTNDEVKSHLQKYRLHVRKIASHFSSGTLMDLNLEGLGKKAGVTPHKFKMVQSDSPEGPLHLISGSSKGISVSMTIGHSLEDEDDDKSESHSWKGRARS